MRIERMSVSTRTKVHACMASGDVKDPACQGRGLWIVWGYYQPEYWSSLVVCSPCLELVKLEHATRPAENKEPSNQ